MYNALRITHLYCGLVLLMFVVMYFTTGVVMTHGEMLPKRATTEVRTEQAISYAGPWSQAELATWAKDQFSIAGRPIQATSKADGSWEIRYANAGGDTRVQIPPSHDKAVLITRTRNAVDAMHGLHRLHGYSGGWVYATWAAMYDLSSVAMIVFGITGIWMWYVLSKRRWPGAVLLAGSFGYAAAMTLYLMYAR